jgi:CBS domain-containing protein
MNEINKKILRPEPEKTFLLSEIKDIPVYNGVKRIGKLLDMLVQEYGTIPHITHFLIKRPFGYPKLLIPMEKMLSINLKSLRFELPDLDEYEKEPESDAMLLRDYILDKKVIDMDEHEVSVVYDVKIIQVNKKLYASDVDFSHYGFYRRLHLKWLAGLFNIKEDLLSWKFVQPLPGNISSFKGDIKLTALKEKLSDISPVDMADIIEELDREQRAAIFQEMPTEQASDTLEELEPNVQREVVSSLKKETVAQLINDMTPAQAADVLAVISFSEKESILQLVDKDMASKIQSILDKQEENILNLTTASFLKFGPGESASDVRKLYQKKAREMDVIMYLYVVDPYDKLLGVLDIKELLIAEDNSLLSEIMTEGIINLTPENTLHDASDLFDRYSFRALPVLDADGKIQGVVPYRDVMELKHRFL